MIETYTVEEFRELVRTGQINEYDGSAYIAFLHEDYFDLSDIPECKYVAWFPA